MTTTIEMRIDDETINAITKYYEKMRFFDLDKESGENRKVAEFLYRTLTKVNLAKSKYRNKDRNKIICKMRDEGRSFSEIAKTFGVTPARIVSIYHSQKVENNVEKMLTNDDIRSCLLAASVDVTGKERMGFKAYDSLLRAGIKLQDIQKYSNEELMNIRNVGAVTVAILRDGYEIYKERNQENA